MTQLCIAASIAAQVATVLGARHATRARRLCDARAVTIADFTLAHDSDLMRRARGIHGPEAQRGALRELDDLRMWARQMGATS